MHGICGRIFLAVQAGVGIFFQQENDGNVYVKTIVSLTTCFILFLLWIRPRASPAHVSAQRVSGVQTHHIILNRSVAVRPNVMAQCKLVISLSLSMTVRLYFCFLDAYT